MLLKAGRQCSAQAEGLHRLYDFWTYSCLMYLGKIIFLLHIQSKIQLCHCQKQIYCISDLACKHANHQLKFFNIQIIASKGASPDAGSLSMEARLICLQTLIRYLQSQLYISGCLQIFCQCLEMYQFCLHRQLAVGEASISGMMILSMKCMGESAAH